MYPVPCTVCPAAVSGPAACGLCGCHHACGLCGEGGGVGGRGVEVWIGRLGLGRVLSASKRAAWQHGRQHGAISAISVSTPTCVEW